MKKDQDYYSKKLFASKLERVYDLASPRVQQYLEAEINYVLKHIKPSDIVLELGCGYGRVLKRLADKARNVVGIDISESSLKHAENYLREKTNVKLIQMNSNHLKFNKEYFDVVLGIQNAISAFKINPRNLIKEAIRVIKPGGKLILSSYSEKFWNDRLKWFINQSKEGLIGEIDYTRTGNGIITCKDGFIATTYSKEDFTNLISSMNLRGTITEVDQSSIFCILRLKRKKHLIK